MESIEHHLAAIQGWLELGDVEQAREELQSIPNAFLDNTDVIRLAIACAVVAGDWQEVMRQANRLHAALPDDEEAAFHIAEAFHQLGQSATAIDNLMNFERLFQDRSVVDYTLARYYCAMNRPEKAMASLGRAFSLRPSLRRKAMDDRDLVLIAEHLRDDDDEFMARYEPDV